jgi:sugar/nucleoside kinase (ribokinase family)
MTLPDTNNISPATFGHRLFNASPQSRKTGLFVLAGSDFPTAIQKQLETWNTTFHVKHCPERPSTRGLLEYQDNTFGPKNFTYTTPPLKPSPTNLTDTPFLAAKAFHILCTPTEIMTQIPQLLALRGSSPRPFVVWEPLPSSCTLDNLSAFYEACKLVDVFSPNHIELASLFSNYASTLFDKGEVEIRASGFACPIVVIRCAEYGSLSRTATETVWLPAYHVSGVGRVVDATGAGNAFLGGFVAGWMEGRGLRGASVWANVAAGLVVEQVGLPVLGGEGEGEKWNGMSVWGRVARYVGWVLGPVSEEEFVIGSM